MEVLQKLELPPKAIAFFLSVPYSTYDKYLRGDATFPPDLIDTLFRATQDYAVVNFFVPEGHRLVPEHGNPTAMDVAESALELGAILGEYLGKLRQAREDGKIDEKERVELEAILRNKLCRKVLDSAECLKAVGGKR
ncbi:MAG: hypothetical protein ACYDH3_00180 [Candidatus Aminicenantales bacterium]